MAQHVTKELIDEYIWAGKIQFLTPAERAALENAEGLANSVSYFEHRADSASDFEPVGELNFELFREPELLTTPETDEEWKKVTSTVRSWKKMILQQLHVAFCTRSQRYAKEVGAIKTNATLLIGAIAGYVAASIGISVAVIAALVAAILRLILAVGVSVFCEAYSKLL